MLQIKQPLQGGEHGVPKQNGDTVPEGDYVLPIPEQQTPEVLRTPLLFQSEGVRSQFTLGFGMLVLSLFHKVFHKLSSFNYEERDYLVTTILFSAMLKSVDKNNRSLIHHGYVAGIHLEY